MILLFQFRTLLSLIFGIFVHFVCLDIFTDIIVACTTFKILTKWSCFLNELLTGPGQLWIFPKIYLSSVRIPTILPAGVDFIKVGRKAQIIEIALSKLGAQRKACPTPLKSFSKVGRRAQKSSWNRPLIILVVPLQKYAIRVFINSLVNTVEYCKIQFMPLENQCYVLN